MGHQSQPPSRSRVWALVKRQHGVVTRTQLLEHGFSKEAIKHRISAGRLHPVHRGVYAVGRPELTAYGRWSAAVLCCGPGAAVSHETAGALWEICRGRSEIHVSAGRSARRRPGIVLHRRGRFDATRHRGIPVTTPACTLVDLATRLGRDPLEAAINEADQLDLIDPEALREYAAGVARRPGAKTLRRLLDRRTFRMTRSTLERRFLPIAEAAGLPRPLTRRYVNGFEVDFYWPELGLVVETDGLRYHRTPAEQARDRLRDQAHAASGLVPLRFTHAQVAFERTHVRSTLAAVARRLRTA